MTNPSHADPDSAGLLKAIVDEEPVIASAITGWLLANVGLVLAHFHLIGVGQWSGLSQVLASPVAGIVLLVIGWLVRHVVTSPKTVRLLQRELDLARQSAATATAAASSATQPIVVQLDGRTIAAAVADSRPAEPTSLDGLPVVLPVIEAPPAVVVSAN